MSKNVHPSRAAEPAFARHRALGHDLIPLHPWDHHDAKGVERGKSPRDVGWGQIPYGDFDALSHRASGGNVGARLSRSDLVLDCDPRNYELDADFEADDPLRRLCADFGIELSRCPRVITGSGGLHVYLKKPPGLDVVGQLDAYPGIDFKTYGTQCVAAGSKHPNGSPYAWDGEPSSTPDAPPALLEALRRPARASGSGGGEHTPEEIELLLSHLDVAKFDSNEEWLQLMFAVHHASGGHARHQFNTWSEGDERYRTRDVRDNNLKRWTSANKDRKGAVTAGTLYWILEKHGLVLAEVLPKRRVRDGEFQAAARADLPEGAKPAVVGQVPDRVLKLPDATKGGKALPTYANALAAVRAAGLGIAWNELKGVAVFRADRLPWDASYGRELDDHTERMVRVLIMQRHGHQFFEPGKADLHEALMVAAYSARFNPIADYLDGLRWDGRRRVERLFPDYMNCGDGGYERAVSGCFMVGAVRRIRRPGCKFDTMPIIKGPQGWNKSSAVRALFGDAWFSDAAIADIRSKDAGMAIRGIWVHEFAELDTMARADVGPMKAFMSRAVDRMRDPYDRTVKDHPRRCVFFGTVNEGGYLRDDTGGRRFWPLEVREYIDLAPIQRDRDQLWAEASAMERDGAPDVLPRDMWPEAARRQGAETVDDPWADVFASYLERREETGIFDNDRVLSRELYDEALGMKTERLTNVVGARIRKVMEGKLKWKYDDCVRVGGKRGAGYVRNGVAPLDDVRDVSDGDNPP